MGGGRGGGEVKISRDVSDSDSLSQSNFPHFLFEALT